MLMENHIIEDTKNGWLLPYYCVTVSCAHLKVAGKNYNTSVRLYRRETDFFINFLAEIASLSTKTHSLIIRMLANLRTTTAKGAYRKEFYLYLIDQVHVLSEKKRAGKELNTIPNLQALEEAIYSGKGFSDRLFVAIAFFFNQKKVISESDGALFELWKLLKVLVSHMIVAKKQSVRELNPGVSPLALCESGDLIFSSLMMLPEPGYSARKTQDRYHDLVTALSIQDGKSIDHEIEMITTIARNARLENISKRAEAMEDESARRFSQHQALGKELFSSEDKPVGSSFRRKPFGGELFGAGDEASRRAEQSRLALQNKEVSRLFSSRKKPVGSSFRRKPVGGELFGAGDEASRQAELKSRASLNQAPGRELFSPVYEPARRAYQMPSNGAAMSSSSVNQWSDAEISACNVLLTLNKSDDFDSKPRK